MFALSIRVWTITFVCSLSIFIVVLLSFFFYTEFQRTLDERILLQLTSIKRLKRVQIEDYLNRKWNTFKDLDESDQHLFDSLYYADEALVKERFGTVANSPIPPGIYDITYQSESGHLSLLFIDTLVDSRIKLAWLRPEEISHILKERTGMGQSGETYLVGLDHRLRSESRFFPKKSPYSIRAKTMGVVKALQGINGKSIIEDYRGIRVYSAFHSLEVKGLKLAILSEIDEEEVLIPMRSVRNKLLGVSFLVLSFGVLASILIALFLSRPVRLMQGFLKQVALGNQNMDIPEHSMLLEIHNTFLILDELKRSLEQLVHFSSEIGHMNLEASFNPRSAYDSLGHSLLLMRDRLKEFNDKAKKSELMARQSLIRGQENERQRLAKELHDGLGPFLTTLKIKVQSSDVEHQLKIEMKAMIDDTILEVRRMTYNLMPPSLIDFGVGEAIAQMTTSIQSSTDVKILYERDFVHTVDVPVSISITIYRIVQELIHNTLKHAQANEVRISLSLFIDKISLYYQDNGRGFDVNQIKKGLGLQNIEERVKTFNGFLDIRASSKGVEVEVEISLS